MTLAVQPCFSINTGQVSMVTWIASLCGKGWRTLASHSSPMCRAPTPRQEPCCDTAKRMKHGSAGLDAWTTREIKLLPPQAWDTLAKLLRRWFLNPYRPPPSTTVLRKRRTPIEKKQDDGCLPDVPCNQTYRRALSFDQSLFVLSGQYGPAMAERDHPPNTSSMPPGNFGCHL